MVRSKSEVRSASASRDTPHVNPHSAVACRVPCRPPRRVRCPIGGELSSGRAPPSGTGGCVSSETKSPERGGGLSGQSSRPFRQRGFDAQCCRGPNCPIRELGTYFPRLGSSPGTNPPHADQIGGPEGGSTSRHHVPQVGNGYTMEPGPGRGMFVLSRGPFPRDGGFVLLGDPPPARFLNGGVVICDVRGFDSRDVRVCDASLRAAGIAA